MSWIIFSILAALIWAIVNTIDKFVLTKWVKKPIIPVMILGIVGLTMSFIIFVVRGFSDLSLGLIIFTLIGGCFYFLGNLFYFQAIKRGEISRVVPLYHLTPLFVLIFAASFLGEIFTFTKYLGIVLLIIGSILISKNNLLKIKFSKAFWFMMLSVLTFTVYIMITKYVLNFTDFWTVFAYNKIGGIFILIPIFYFNFKDLKETVKRHGKKVIGVITFSETLSATGALFYTIAASVGFITLVEVLTSLQSLFLFFIVTGISIFYPNILKEEINKKIIIIKISAIIIMILGAFLVA